MSTTCSTLTAIALAAATTLALGAYAAPKLQDPVASQSAATSIPSPSASIDTIPAVSGYHPSEIPPVPLFSVPTIDVFASNTNEAVIQIVSSSLQSAPGITISPVKCDSNVLISGSTVFGSDGSASTSIGNGAIINNGDGAGSIAEGPIITTYGGGGSGSYVNSDTYVSLFILLDDEGAYSVGSVSVFIDSRGYDNYSNSETDESIVSNGDGSDNYSVGKTLIYNDRDGSGSYSDGTLSIINYGDGTALMNGAMITDAPRIEPLPTFGKFPPVESLKPAESCNTVIILKGGTLFDLGKPSIRSGAAHTLSKLVTVLNDVKVPAAHIYDHTDSISDETFNLQLSRGRVDAVPAELKRDGMSVILDAIDCGEPKPVTPNENASGLDNPAGRVLSRRVEIFTPVF